MNSSSSLAAKDSSIENSLIWPIFEVLKSSGNAWKVHILSAHLNRLGYIPELDAAPEKDVFKRNFLIMNALYQLQEILIPEYWLQVEAMNIQLFFYRHTSSHAIDSADPLREYYLEWSNYEASEGEVKRLLNQFWEHYQSYIGGVSDNVGLTRKKALELFELDDFATPAEIRKRWRKLALKWHPDRDGGNSDTFRMLCEAWNLLRI
ncbi:DNA-J related domain-containing protein [Vibrio salinus]|uniref:DNA-J related domain-containing protein n=1 Tax=Vibrio salinus TaxID=2899784 RepID=UPI001E4B52E3|nr:DNA-J related domain-containing protein [Vibrio salinus]MCE0496062.1 DnaJ domain-containing protein [Vibrio salinus]